MAVPKRKTSKSKNKMRQANKGLVKKNNIFFDKEGNMKISHIVRKAKRVKKQDNKENETK